MAVLLKQRRPTRAPAFGTVEGLVPPSLVKLTIFLVLRFLPVFFHWSRACV